jgi:hypothetical protein
MPTRRSFRSQLTLLAFALCAAFIYFAHRQAEHSQEVLDFTKETTSSVDQTTGDPLPKAAVPAEVLPPSHLLTTDERGQPKVDGNTYREVFSNSTVDQSYFPIHFGGIAAYNPNIIPHPTRDNTWIVVAQREGSSSSNAHVLTELFCNAGFINDVLTCVGHPAIVPLEHTQGHCEGALTYINFSWGPRDARVIYGPTGPYILYGSHSKYTCLGVYVQNLRLLLDDFEQERILADDFVQPTELHRPPPFGAFEKNFFLFWDNEGAIYAHHEIAPNRVFAKLALDGTVGDDLGPAVRESDAKCMKRFMPKVALAEASIHQATNSLAITMCKRTNPNCKPSDTNTFIFSLFQYKTYFDFHSIYEPYLMIFSQKAPFALHAISTKALWIHGRDGFTEKSGAVQWADKPLPKNHSEMFYVTSINWKARGQRYHGYLDDVLFLAFGIEDSRAGAIDIVAEDLLQDLGFCSDAE